MDLTILAQEIIVDNAAIPTERIGRTRTATGRSGLGYANLGALLMATRPALRLRRRPGLRRAPSPPSCRARRTRCSARNRRTRPGPFAGYAKNREPCLRRHAQAPRGRRPDRPQPVPAELSRRAARPGTRRSRSAEQSGFRNGQVTVLAPTGTIGFMMDCDTTGIEPDIALVKYKKLVGGGMLKIVNNTVPLALQKLGYARGDRTHHPRLHRRARDDRGRAGLKAEHLPVFDCAFKPSNGTRTIH